MWTLNYGVYGEIYDQRVRNTLKKKPVYVSYFLSPVTYIMDITVLTVVSVEQFFL